MLYDYNYEQLTIHCHVVYATMGLRGSPVPYKGISGYENAATRLHNEYFWVNSV